VKSENYNVKLKIRENRIGDEQVSHEGATTRKNFIGRKAGRISVMNPDEIIGGIGTSGPTRFFRKYFLSTFHSSPERSRWIELCRAAPAALSEISNLKSCISLREK
jgi:hypothetical protein